MLWTKEGEKGMTEIGLIICLCVIGILLMIALSAYTAYKTVFSSETVCKKEKKMESDSEVSFDDICNEYLKLTNVD